jgi:hypothetical protein
MMDIVVHGWVAVWAGIAAVYVSVAILAMWTERQVPRRSRLHGVAVVALLLWAVFAANVAVLAPNEQGPWAEVALTGALGLLVALPILCECVSVLQERPLPPGQAAPDPYGPLLRRVQELRAKQIRRRPHLDA